MATAPYIIGLDIGTTKIKALAFSLEGEMLALCQENCPNPDVGEGRNEHDPEIIYRLVISCLQAVISKSGRPAGIGLSAYMHSFMPTDENQKPLTNLWLWSDRRSSSAAESLRNSEIGRQIYEASGTPLHPMSPLCKIKWLAENRAELFGKSRYFSDVKSYILYRLTGEFVLDYSVASASGLFDNRQKKWCREALDFCGISENRLPKTVGSDEIFSCINLEIGLGIPIVPGLGDGCAANLGAGSLTPDELTLTLGTSAALRFTGPVKTTDPEEVLFSYCLDNQFYINGGASNNCGNVVNWAARLFAQDLPSFRADFAAETGLHFSPRLYGERAPVQLNESVAGFLGMKAEHSPKDFMSEVIKSIIFNTKMIADKLYFLNDRSFRKVHISGGLSNLPGLKELTASVFNLPVAEHQSEECSALGIALFTAKNLNYISDYQVINEWNPILNTFEPDSREAEIFARQFAGFEARNRAFAAANGFLQI